MIAYNKALKDKFDALLDKLSRMYDLVIVDTPGLNGLADKHRELTIEEIKRAHACIYLFPKRGIAHTDIDFIKYISTYQNTFIFIYNFIDELNISEGENPDDKIASIKENVNKFIALVL